MPDWFKPGTTPPTASQRPARPDTADRPKPPGTGDRPMRPGTGDRPVAKPPIADGRPPGTRPPGFRPPVNRPPYHPWYPNHPNYHDRGHWWKWATAGAITGWVAYQWTNPIYYQYGSGGNVYYENNVVYVNGNEYGSAEQYYNEASEIASAAPETTDEQAQADDWMPLGVFAITKEGVNASSMYLQLAIRKDGLIGGTFYNESTGVTHPVEGMVDEKTQRAVWKAADGTNADVIMETGIYNLSEDEANILVHFGPDETQEALLVRLDESEESPPAE